MLAKILIGLNLFLLALTGLPWLVWWFLAQPFPLWALPVFWLLSFLLLHALIVANMFRTSERHRSACPDEHKLSTSQWLRLLAAEWRMNLRLFAWLFPLERLFRAGINRRGSYETPLPVLFLHGYVCNGAYWKSLAAVLRARGIGPCYTLNLEPTFGCIGEAGALVARRCAELAAAHGQPVAIVGHSMGGLVARAAVLQHDAAPFVRSVICLGTPHLGTIAAHKGIGKNSAQMRRDSAWLKALNEMPWPDSVKLVSLYTHHDNIVFPQDSSHLPYGENVAFSGIGHLELAWNPRVQAVVADRLKALQA